MTEANPVVFIVDDDASVREGLEDLFQSVGIGALTFGSTQEFLKSTRPDSPGCIVLDVRLPGQSGLEFQRQLAQADIHLPVIFISGHGDIPMSVQAMKSGAIEFLTKPLHDQQLLDAVQAGLERDRIRRLEARTVAELRSTLRVADAQRTGSIRAGHQRATEQADRGLARVERDDSEGPSQSTDAKNASQVGD